MIADFQDLDREAVLRKLRALGDEAACYLRDRLDEALSSYQRVICLTHVPPFKEACWYQGKMGNDDWLPYFACQAVGEVLLYASRERPDCQITVLCGHTHHAGTVHLRPNLRVLTGSAEYGAPCIQESFDLEELFPQSMLVEGGEGEGGAVGRKLMRSESNQELLNKSGPFVWSRYATRVGFSHPLIAMPGDETVHHISKRPGNDDEGIQPGPSSRKAAKNFESCSGFCEDLPVFQQ